MIKFTNCKCQIEKGQFDINKIDLDCPAVWKLISSGHTVGVFQLEKKLGQDWARKVQPDSMEGLSALISILRPGPLEAGMSQDYVDIKFERKKSSYLHPTLKPILEPTYACLLYQEQAIKIATDIAGFSPEIADDLRKAIGKKLPELMAKMRDKFVDGCKNHSDIGKGMAEEIFGWIEKCQRYSFNKSHAISYGMIAYQTAWMKCHFPHEFFASYLTFSNYKIDPKEEIYGLVQDARFFGIEILSPDIRRGNVHFEIVDEASKGVAFGLSHVRGVGQSAISKIMSDGTKRLKTWANFLAAVPDFHRNVGIALIKSGACDCYGMERCTMIRELEVVLGTTVRDEEGKKVDVKGLTKKEKEYFFPRLQRLDGTTCEILTSMSEPPDTSRKTLSQMNKPEVVDTAMRFFKESIDIVDDGAKFAYTKQDEKDRWIGLLPKRIKKCLIALLLENGYKDAVVKPPCSNDSRRRIMVEKAAMLADDIVDSSKAKAMAEKHFLGIALSCSPVDDADGTLASHTCLEIARAGNKEAVVVCAIIDAVKHIKTKRGKNPGQPMCFLTLSDSTYSIDYAVVFPSSYSKLKGFCKEDLICLVYGEKRNGSFIIEDMQKLI